jgi:hypothetical protein
MKDIDATVLSHCAAGNRNLGLALVNPSDTASTISLTLRNDNGSTVSTMPCRSRLANKSPDSSASFSLRRQ